MTKEDIFRIVEEEDVEFIRLQFTDMFGMLKNIAITVSQLEKAVDRKFMFDGSSVEGFVRIEESDMYLHPDLDTFEIFPWRPQQGKVARLICDVYRPGGKAFDADPRNMLKRAVAEAAELGYSVRIGAECEFFLFHTDEEGNPTTKTHERASYFDVGPLDMAENVRRDIVLNLEEMGYIIEASHHETANAQHEVDFACTEALAAADQIMTFRLAVRTIARRHGLHATFMPKPRAGINGSGMHINLCLCDREGNNIFENDSDENGLSREAYGFIAGVLEHAGEMSLLTNPIVNSYKRLVPGYDAPVCISWSSNSNRTQMIRVPSQRGDDTRLELRAADSSANPYYVLAAYISAGMDGIRRGLKPGDCVNSNIFAMSAENLIKNGIKPLPGTLGRAIEEFESSEFIIKLMGEHAYSHYLQAKKREWESFGRAVTDWELSEYMYRY